MVAVFTGTGLGVERGSGFVLGSRGQLGSQALGRYGENVYVNAATGNLAIQRQDELLIGRGLDDSVSRSYNSLGTMSDDNGDNWQLAQSRRVTGLTGTVNTAGSTVTRYAWDGSNIVYTWDATKAAYVSKESSGAYDTLTFASNVWTWTDGDTRQTEAYDGLNAGRITSARDAGGNALTFTYTGSLLTRVTTANGERTDYGYTGNNLTQVVTTRADATTETRVRYTYDTSNRLSTVTTDLSPTDNSVSDGKTVVTTYTYDGTSKRVASIGQTGGASLAITYTLVGSDYRVATLTQAQASGVTSQTGFSYDTTNRVTTITDAQGNVTRMTYDASGNLTRLEQPAATTGAATQVSNFAYNANGDVTSITDAAGDQTAYTYDANGNLTLARDAAGNTASYTYDANNNRLTETHYLVPDPDGAGSGQPSQPVTTRYAYDATNHLRYTVSDEGRVTRYDYNANGQLTRTAVYATNLYSTSGLAVTASLSQATLDSWTSGISDKSGFQITDTTYDARGNVATTTGYTATDTSGVGLTTSAYKVMTFVYDQAGNLLSAHDNRTSATQAYVYDGLNRLVGSTDLSGASTSIVFTDASNTSVVTAADGSTTTAVYDLAGELISTSLAGSGVSAMTTTNAYDSLGRLRMVTNALGQKSYFLYDNAGRKVADITADGALTETAWDAANRVARTIRYATKLTSTQIASLVDSNGKPANVTLATLRPTANAADSWTWNVYDSADRLIETINAVGSATVFAYDGANQLVRTTAYATALSATVLSGFKTTQPTTLQLPTADAVHDRVTRNFYSNDGLPVGSLDGDGALTQIVYDAAGQKIRTTTYGNFTTTGSRASGTFAQLLQGVGTNIADRQTDYVYDDEGALRYTVEENANGIRGRGSNISRLTEFAYDVSGNLIHTTVYAGTITAPASNAPYTMAYVQGQISTQNLASNTANRITHAVYDNANRVAFSIDAEGGVTQLVYDAAGRPTKTVAYASVNSSTTDSSLSAWQSWASTYASSANDRTSYTLYDTVSRPVYHVDPLGYVSESQYDALGRVVKTVRYAAAYSVGDATTTASLKTAIGAIPATAVVSTMVYDTAGRMTDVTDGVGAVTHYVYDALDRVTFVTLAYGTVDAATTQTTYDASDRPITVTSASGTADATTTRYSSYDALGNLLSIVTGSGNSQSATVTNSYDALGHLLQTTDANRAVTTYGYDTFGNQVTVTDARGNISYRWFDQLGRLNMQVDAEGYATATSYSQGDGVVAITHYATKVSGTLNYGAAPTITANAAQDATTRFTRDKLDRVTVSTDAMGNYEQYTLDAFGNRTSVRNKLGGTTLNTFDKRGLLVSEKLPQNSVNSAGTIVATTVTNTYAYDARGNRTTMVEAAGLAEARTTSYAYDKRDQLISKTGSAFATLNTDRTNTTSSTPVETFKYDLRGNVIEHDDPAGARTLTYYDDNDRKIAQINALGTLTTWTYDVRGNALTATMYGDAVALPATAGGTPPAPVNAANNHQIAYSYDKNDRLAGTSVAAMTVGERANGVYGEGVQNVVTSTLYDATGNIVQQTDARGNSIFSFYNKDGRKIAEVDQEKYLTTYDLDDDGNVLTETRYATRLLVAVGTTSNPATLATNAGSSADDRITQFTYDKNGNRLTETRLNMVATSISASGVPTTTTSNATISYSYNGLGLVTRKTQANGDYTDFSYDQTGRTTQIAKSAYVDSSGTSVRPTTDMQYDGLGELIRQLVRGTDNSTEADDHVTTYAYDKAGHVATMTDASGFITRSSYDVAGNLVKQQWTRQKSDGTSVTEADFYSYDLLGHQVGQQKGTFVSGTSWTLSTSTDMAYDAYGQMTGRGINAAGASSKVYQEFADYDAMGRVWRTNFNDGITKAYVYDANGNATLLLQSTGSVDLRSLTLDQMVAPGSGVTETQSVFDKRNQLVETLQPSIENAAQRPGSINGFDTVTAGANFTGGAADVGATRGANGNQGYASPSPGNLSARRQGTVSESQYSSNMGSVTLTYFTVNISPSSFVGSGDIHINADGYAAYSGPPKSTINWSQYSANYSSFSVYQDLPNSGGSVLIGQVSRNSSVATRGSIEFQNQDPRTSRLMLFARPQGSSGPYQAVGTSKFTNLKNAAIDGWFTADSNATPFNGMPANTGWDILYYAMGATGNTLNAQTATLSVDGSGNPSFANVAAQPINAPGAAILTREGGTDYLILSQQASGTQSVLMSYRPVGSNAAWSTTWLGNGYGQAGLWAADVTGWGGPYEYWLQDFDGSNGSGTLLAKSNGTFTVGGQPSVLTGYNDLAETVHFLNQPAATSMALWYKPAGTGSWIQAANPTWNSGRNAWDWDANGITPDKLSNYQYDFRYELYNGSLLVNQAHGTVQLGYNPAVFSNTVDQAPATVVFAPPQGNATTLVLNYRPNGSMDARDYRTITLGKDASGRFSWNTEALRPDNGAASFEYFYDLYDGSGNAVAPVGGQEHATGYVTINADRSTDVKTLQWVLANSADPAATIDRTQAYNAFGDIVSETDGLGHTTTMAYNVMGKLILKQSPQTDSTDEHGTVTRVNPSELYYYDIAGRLVATQDANGNVNKLALLAGSGEGDGDAITTKEFHADGGVRSYGIDVFGNTRTVTDELNAITTNSYDKMDRLVQVVRPTRVGGNSAGVALTDSYGYDSLGERIKHTQTYALSGSQAVYAAQIYRLYDAAFNRPADSGGYSTYMGWMASGTTISQLGDTFYASSEYQSRGVASMTNLQFAQFLYTSVLRRPAEAGAAENLANAISSGSLTRGQALVSISESTEHINIVSSMPDRLPPLANQTETTDYDAQGRVAATTSFAGQTVSYSYTYQDGSVLGTSGLGAFGGWQVATTMAGRTSLQSIDMFGRTVWAQDYGSRQSSYTYDKAGHLVGQTSTAGQNISYAYYGNGYIRSITDNALGMVSTFEYDKEGNRTLESYASTGANPVYYQLAVVTYDELNRLKTFTDAKATISYQYDADSNRRRVVSYYHDGINGGAQTQDYWYKYDSMNRFTLTMGQMSGSTIVSGADGVQISYDLAGQRKIAIYESKNSREDYSYTADGYLEDTNINSENTSTKGALATRRVNDAMGRVTTYTTYLSNGSTVKSSQASTYDGDNRITDQVLTQRQEDGSYTTTNVHNDYRADTGGGAYNGTDQGAIIHSREQTGSVVQDTVYSYQWWDQAKETGIQVKASDSSNPNSYQWGPGASQLIYDVNGHLSSAVLTGGPYRNVTYTNDAYGQVLERETTNGNAIGPRQLYYYLDGNRIGDVGNDGPSRVDYATALAQTPNPVAPSSFRYGKAVASADFDQNYEPIGPNYPGMASSSYTVRGGDTLATIAQSLWGDSSLWYMIADANGLTGSDTLVAGQRISIPNKVTNIHNRAGVYRVYNPGEAIGDVMPTLPPEPAPPVHNHGGCGIIGQVLLVAVAVAVSVVTFHAADAALGPVVAGVLGGAAGSVASQAVGVATGLQDHFSFKGVAMAAIAGGIGGGVGSLGILKGATGITGTLQTVARGVIGSGLSQGVDLAIGLQSQFDWTGVAAAGVSSGFLGNASKAGSGVDHYLAQGLAGSAAAIAAAGVRSLFTGSDFGDNILRALPDVVGQTIGNLAAGAVAGREGPHLTYDDAVRDREDGRIQTASAGVSDGPEIVVNAPTHGLGWKVADALGFHGDFVHGLEDGVSNLVANAVATTERGLQFGSGVAHGLYNVGSNAAVGGYNLLTTNPITTAKGIGFSLAHGVDSILASEDTPAWIQLQNAAHSISNASAFDIGYGVGNASGNIALLAAPELAAGKIGSLGGLGSIGVRPLEVTAESAIVRTAAQANQAMVEAGNLAAWGGSTVTTETVAAGTRFNMVVSEGQAQALMAGKPAFGAWATPDVIPSQAFARSDLAILPEFKPDVSFVAQVETTMPQTLNRGIVGPLGDYAGGANQVEFLGSRNIKLVGQPQTLPLGR